MPKFTVNVSKTVEAPNAEAAAIKAIIEEFSSVYTVEVETGRREHFFVLGSVNGAQIVTLTYE